MPEAHDMSDFVKRSVTAAQDGKKVVSDRNAVIEARTAEPPVETRDTIEIFNVNGEEIKETKGESSIKGSRHRDLDYYLDHGIEPDASGELYVFEGRVFAIVSGRWKPKPRMAVPLAFRRAISSLAKLQKVERKNKE